MTVPDLIPQPDFIKATLNDLEHVTDLLTDREEERNELIRELVQLGVSCRTIAQHTNLSYKTVHDNFYPNGRKAKRNHG